MEEQHSLEWFRRRLGFITGSKVGDLMKTSRKAGEVFGDTAKTYLYQLAAERSMNQEIIEDDDLFTLYIQQVEASSKAMRWGNEQEEHARRLYSKITGRCISEVGSCRHDIIPYFASSPDGICEEEKGCLEIKCPIQSTFMKYKSEIHDNDSLKDVNPTYFYQCMSHMMCTDSDWTDFIIYCPFQKDPINIVRIYPDDKVFQELETRIELANEFIENLIK